MIGQLLLNNKVFLILIQQIFRQVEFKMKLFFLIFIFLGAIINCAVAKIKIIDGDSFWLKEQEIRLEGIDAPEYNQQCYDEKENLYDCGRKATEHLRRLIKNDVKCIQTAKDKYKRKVMICESNGKIINKEMVASGWAVAYTQYTKEYINDERLAKKTKKGVWQGRFMRPELFRALTY